MRDHGSRTSAIEHTTIILVFLRLQAYAIERL